ncbi:MAG: TonB-dependent receptor [candidate division Zixibacteria bacterium]|nr:TonB-dependent receptor [candidate division Zixibacteria bacterium]MDH3937176.1 TonB-dependent receptor [candidate division Zixibacteria bacterium]MDH4033806.1 TonB-dependent receptor [candidate division Zixibacteria bacterium]
MKCITALFIFTLSFSLPSQAFDLSGKVVDDNGDPIIGVSVVTDVTGVGTATDEQGAFTLPQDVSMTRITFSAVGYRSRQFHPGSLPEKVQLEPVYIRGEDIQVTADRAKVGVTPIAFDNLSSEDIERDYTVGEFPLLLASTPNLHAFSDGGTPLGYSYMKIRGFDDKRISTYINGVPLNDPEDQATYFVDLPDFAANVTDIQVQRGVGNSLYGDASFGGSVNIVTSGFNRERKTTLSFGYGEYTSDGGSVSDIYKQSLEYSSGLIDGRWSFAGRFSKQKTGGYRYNSWYRGWSYYFSVARLDRNSWTELFAYGGPMKMHLAYSGASREVLDADRRANPYHTYSNETDNFNQPHYHLHNIYRLGDRATLSNTLYYIRGRGFYEQFKQDRWYPEYNLDASMTGGEQEGDLVRQQWVEKNQYGWNPRLDIDHDRGRHSMGGSLYYFESDHWGQVVWAQHITGSFDPQHRYYQYNGKKVVGSVWLQENYELTEQLSVLTTAQIRYQRYSFDQAIMGAFRGYDYTVDWLFFSPRIGFNYDFENGWSMFSTFAISSRTPTDAAIYDANDPSIMPSLEIESVSLTASGDSVFQFGDPTAANERVYDFELGGEYRQPGYALGINGFWMRFNDEIIPNGGINDNTGLPITVNADHSVHAGVELTAAVKPREEFKLDGNFSYNYNRIRNHREHLGWVTLNHNGRTIPGFPEYLGNFIVDYNADPFRATMRTHFVGKQFMELNNLDDLAIDPYWTASVSLAYTAKNLLGLGTVTVQARIDNLFDRQYETSGYGDSYVTGVEPNGDLVASGWAEYFVGPERSIYGQVKVDLF